jgi:hypothetical protein
MASQSSIRSFLGMKVGLKITLLGLLLMMACSKTNTIRKNHIQPLSITHAIVSRAIKMNGNLSSPERITQEFSPQDREVVSHVGFADLTGEHRIRWEWYTPARDLYQTTGNCALNARAGRYVKTGTAHHALALKNTPAATHRGDWQVKIYLDDHLAVTDNFRIDLKAPQEISQIKFGNYHALVIGIDHYRYLPQLKNADNDAKAVAELLKDKYHFKVVLLMDAARSDIISALDDIRMNLTQEDNLLIYYAGHGILDNAADEGYWLPLDAKENSTLNWISNGTVTAAIKAMQARHVIVVADSCYSGKLIRSIRSPFSRGIGVGEKRSYYETMAAKRSRTVMCSGGLEPVEDGDMLSRHSVFAAAFTAVLATNEKIMDGTQLFSKIRRPVVLNADQTPEYSDIRRAGHDGGDFLFVPQRLLQKEK